MIHLSVFVGSGLSVPLWDFLGGTMVTNTFVRLTPDHQSRQGAIWNSKVSGGIVYTNRQREMRVFNIRIPPLVL